MAAVQIRFWPDSGGENGATCDQSGTSAMHAVARTSRRFASRGGQRSSDVGATELGLGIGIASNRRQSRFGHLFVDGRRCHAYRLV